MVLDIDVPLVRFTLSVRWETSTAALGVFGHSGAGKTTLLEAVAGLRKVTRGTIRVNDRLWLDTERGFCLPPERRGVGYVPQDALLFPHRDVNGNLMAGRRRASTAGDHGVDPKRVVDLLELGPVRSSPVTMLSGGERQRVALGRALCSGADLLLLDEPLASLDQPLRRRILPYLVRVQDEFGIPSLYVSHDATEVRLLSEEVMVLSAGRVMMVGRPDEVFTAPSVLPMARAEGFENVLRGPVLRLEEATAVVEVADNVLVRIPGHGLVPADEAVIAIRAEDLILSLGRPQGLSAQNILPGVIREVREPAGEEKADGPLLAIVDLGGTSTLVVAITRNASRQLALSPGAGVHAVFKTQACRLLATRRPGERA